MPDTDILELRRLIGNAERVVAFTGAGISTESGIPDFRGPNGLWKKQKPMDFSEFVSSEEARRTRFRSMFSGNQVMRTAEPNAGHLAVAALYRMGKLTDVITQNVDGLHQKAGVPDDRVIELHGNAGYCSCLDCGKRYEMDEVRAMFLPDETVPYCTDCNGIIKSATISFGQQLPVAAIQRAETAVMNCDLMLVMGSSLVVYPAAMYPRIAKQSGARLVIVNNEPTDLDPLCDLILHRPIGETMSSVVD